MKKYYYSITVSVRPCQHEQRLLAQYGINAVVTGITMDAGKNIVLVQISANLERIFPSVVPIVVVTETGYAQIRAFSR